MPKATYVLLDRGGSAAAASGMGSPSQNSSLNYLELLYVVAVCLMSRGFFFDWGTPHSFAQPSFHIINAAIFLLFADPRMDFLAFTTLVDLLAFGAQYSMHTNAVDIDQYHFDDYQKQDGFAKNWTKLGLTILPLVIDLLRVFLYVCTRPAYYGSDKRDEDDDVEEVTTTVQPQQQRHHTVPMTRYGYVPVATSQLGW